MKLKIQSWNIWCDGDMEGISKFLAGSNADIIGLQEVMSNDKTRDVIGYLTGLGYHYIYAEAIKYEDGNNIGNAIFTKHDIIKSATHILSETDSRNAVSADIVINGSALHIFSTHLLHTHQKPSDTQILQAENLLKTLPTERTILMGDFNATPQSVAIQKIRAVLVDSDTADAPTWSVHPAGCSVCLPQKIDTRLDYIFTTKDLKTADFTVGKSQASDHLPISVIIEV